MIYYILSRSEDNKYFTVAFDKTIDSKTQMYPRDFILEKIKYRNEIKTYCRKTGTEQEIHLVNNKYLRTDRNNISEDNLNSLPLMPENEMLKLQKWEYMKPGLMLTFEFGDFG